VLHSQYFVDILSEDGRVIGQKKRVDLNKYLDIYHSANIILITPVGQLVLQTIPINELLPNVYVGRVGTIATIVRSGETPEEAAKRCLSRELFIDDMPLIHLGSKMHDLIDGRKSYISAFYGIAEPPGNFSVVDIECLVVLSPHKLDQMAKAKDPLQRIAINLVTIWREYRDKFPV
jgi:hypothetical protein